MPPTLEHGGGGKELHKEFSTVPGTYQVLSKYQLLALVPKLVTSSDHLPIS